MMFCFVLQVCVAYTTRRRTQRWPICLLYHMIDISCFNAFILFTTINPRWTEKKKSTKGDFLTEMGLALTEPECLRRARGGSRWGWRAAVAAVAVRSAKRKQCGYWEKPQRASNFCGRCGKAICHKHTKHVCFDCLKKKRGCSCFQVCTVVAGCFNCYKLCSFKCFQCLFG